MRSLGKGWLHVGLAVSSMLAGCGRDGPRGPRPEEVPPSIDVAAAKIEVGFHVGRLRSEAPVGAFRITETPVTWREYAHCTDAGACEKASRPVPGCQDLKASPGSIAELPVTCATASQAEAYCRWIGGRLPSLEEWQLAARGPKVTRYAWGNDAPDCARHAGGRKREGDVLGEACVPLRALAPAIVREHKAGASPIGLQDVLSAPAELLRRSPESTVAPCRGTEGACLVTGVEPGSIDSAAGVSNAAQEPLFSFRCVREVP
jgi:formylglycine-generating enzyme required for sulfatase activity